MSKYLLLAILFSASIMATAQQDKYLAGAVPEVNGKVVFEKSISVKQKISDDKLFTLMEKWANDNYKADDSKLINKVLLADPQKREIACAGGKYLVFKKSALVLDQAKMIYQLIMEIENGKCDVTIRNIKYDYPDNKELQTAEDIISDKVAINKKGDKLNRYFDKFRRQSIDSINQIFQSIDIYLNGINKSGMVGATEAIAATPAPEYQQTQPVQEPVRQNTEYAMAGFKKIAIEKIPASLLDGEALLLTGTTKEPIAAPIKWRGVTTLMNKPLSIVNIDTNRFSIIDNAETYTILFFTEIYKDDLLKFNDNAKSKSTEFTPIKTQYGAPAFSEAWMIIECKKSGEMPSEKAETKTCLGEILNVWIK